MKKFLIALLIILIILFLCMDTAKATEEISEPIHPKIDLATPTPTPIPTPSPTPVREIHIDYSPRKNVMEVGDEVTLSATLINFYEGNYHYTWQYSIDGNTWTDISNSDSDTYTFKISQENYRYYWRIKVYH